MQKNSKQPENNVKPWIFCEMKLTRATVLLAVLMITLILFSYIIEASRYEQRDGQFHSNPDTITIYPHGHEVEYIIDTCWHETGHYYCSEFLNDKNSCNNENYAEGFKMRWIYDQADLNN